MRFGLDISFIKVNTFGMEITEHTHTQIVEALRLLQEQGESLNSLADEAGVTRSWIHRLKNDAIGAETWRKIFVVAKFLADKHPTSIGNTPALRVQPINTDSRSGYEVRV